MQLGAPVLLLFGGLLVALFLHLQLVIFSRYGLEEGLKVSFKSEVLSLKLESQRLESELKAVLQSDVEALKLKTHRLEKELQILQHSLPHERPLPADSGSSVTDACTLTKRLESLSSKEEMLSAGWSFNLDEIHAADKGTSGIVGWQSGGARGSLSATFRAPGRLTVAFGNVYNGVDSPDNLVSATLNEERVLELRQGETHKEFCLHVLAGDILELSEVFAQVHLIYLKFECGEHGPREELAETRPTTDGVSCSRGQRAWMSRSFQFCSPANSMQLFPVQVERAINESHAVIEAQTGVYRIVPAHSLLLAEQFSAPRCGKMQYTRAHFGIVVVADAKFQVKYAYQIKTMRCYATARNYEFALLHRDSFEKCKRIYDIFFMKPCLVALHLEQKPADYIAAFLDADTVPVILERGLEEWLHIDADLHFYERDWLPEVMSGIFFAKNKPWVRTWLVTWSEFLFRRPPGFSSADNGALHQHFVETMGLSGAGRCGEMYSGLVAGGDNRTPYWNFVECTNAVMGAPATFKTCARVGSDDCGLLAIWPRFNFAAIDGMILDFKISKFIGPVMLHNIKQNKDVLKLYSDVDTCERNPSSFLDRDTFGARALSWSRCCNDLFPQFSKTCSQCVDRCLASFTCEPLPLGADPKETIAAKRKVNVLNLP